MGRLYSVGVKLTYAIATGDPYAVIHTGANPAMLREIQFVKTTTQGAWFSLRRNATLGVVTASKAFQAGDPTHAASTTVVDTDWSTEPTVVSEYLRRFALYSATAGSAGVHFQFRPGEIIIPANAGLEVFCHSGVDDGNLEFFAVIEE